MCLVVSLPATSTEKQIPTPVGSVKSWPSTFMVAAVDFMELT